MKRGRPRKDLGEGESEVVEKAKPRSIAIDPELFELINNTADALSEQLGFRPTLSQSLSYLIKNANIELPKVATKRNSKDESE